MLDTSIRGRFSASAAEVKADLDQTVQESVVEQSTRERAQAAVGLLRNGRRDEAMKLFSENVREIESYLANGGNASATIKEMESSNSSFANRALSASPGAVNDYSKQ